jgi:putative sterol carrier protein
MEESLMPPTLAEIMAKVPEAFVPEKAGDVNAIVHFKFTGAEAGEWNATIRDGTCRIAQGIPRSRPTITVAADSDDYRRIVTGDLDPSRAFMDGKLRLTGDANMAMRLVSMFRMP